MSLSFALGGVTKTVQNPDLDDKLGLDPHQVVQPKASGGYYRFALAAATDSIRELRWSNLRLSELNDLQSFFKTTSEGTLKTFLFTDERGANYDAYFLNTTLDPVTIADEQRWGGTFSSGGNTIPTTGRGGGFYALTIRLHLKSPASFATAHFTTPPGTSPHTEPPPWTSHHTSGPTSPHTAPPEYALESDLDAHEDLTATAHGGLIPSSARGANNGVASLDSGGKVPTDQLPSAVLGALDYQGAWDCSTAAYPSTPAKGQYWVCSGAGTISGTAYAIGDWLTYNGSSWNRIDNQQAVVSVNAKVGAVSLSYSDVGADAAGAAASAQSAAEAASIPTSALVTSVGSPGSDSNVPSEKAVRTALGSAISTAEAACDPAGAAASAQSAAEAASIPASALVTSVGSPGSDSNVPSEKAVRTGLTNATGAAVSAAEAACDAAGAAATVQGNLNTHTGLTTTAHGGIIASSEKGANSGVATLDSGGHLTAGQIPTALVGAVAYQGAWDCSTAAYPTTPAAGQYWVCSVAGTISGTSYAIGDWLIYNGSAWERLDGSISLANLGGGAEAVGGSASNGTAATAARSDHVHAISAISAATESVAGLMAAADKTKLDGIASGATALSLANLGGGAETVGGSGSNGSAATAARSDHTHAINAIGNATESAAGLMSAVDKTTLDGLAANWRPLVATTDFSTTAATTSTITMNTDQTANIAVGTPIKVVNNGNTLYAICTAITSGLLTIAGPALNTGATLTTAISFGRAERVDIISLFIAGASFGATDTDLLADKMNSYFKWLGAPAYLVTFSAVHKTAAGTTNEKVNVKIGGNSVSTNDSSNGVQLSTAGTWVDNPAATVSSTYYAITNGTALTVACTAADVTASTAKDLTVLCVFVMA